ncbi:hypothetical protein BGX24_004564 [Mortierella sp. AD032]|nr:hypothetical protein BGX24_004564 [Mortierella sp. AD032]
MALDTNPNFIRSHISRRSSTNNVKVFFDTIICQSLTDTDVIIMPQLSLSIRTLLDIKSELRNEDDKDNENLPSERTVAKRLPDLTPEDEMFLSDFYKQFLLLPTKVTLNFFRACLKRMEKCFNQMLVRNKVIHGVTEIIQETKSSMNVLNTACLDFFGFIRKVLDLQNGHDAEADEKAFKALIASRLKEILPAHLRPLFKDTRQKLKDTDLEETSHSGSRAHKKQRTQVSLE